MQKVKVHWHTRKKMWSGRTGQKNVHAFAVGNLEEEQCIESLSSRGSHTVGYNPFMQDLFTQGNGIPVNRASVIEFFSDGEAIAWGHR